MDENYLPDLDKILSSIFNWPAPALQPKFLIEIDCQDGQTLRHAYHFIQSKTNRGKKLTEYPFEIIALILDKSLLPSIRKNLEKIPHQIVLLSDIKVETIREVLQSINDKDLEQSLYLQIDSKHSQRDDFLAYLNLKSHFGIIQFLSKHQMTSPDKYLLELSKIGWFPRAGACYNYPDSFSTLIYYEQRPYVIREAKIDDLSSLNKLEELCWTKTLAMPVTVLRKRIESYPEGQLVLANAEGVQGVVYSQRIATIEELYHKQADTVSQLHTSTGTCVQLLALNIAPEKQQGEWGGELLEFILQKASFTQGVNQVIGVTRCIEYPGADKISMEDYLKEKNLDPVLKMHARHGAEIRGVVPNYRPLDDANNGYGILVVYPLISRTSIIETIHLDSFESSENEITHELIEKGVDQAIINLLSEDKKEGYNRTIPLMDLGLDSLQLMELRSMIGWKFSIELQPTFFFQYGTAQAAIEYLIEKKLEVYKDWLYEIQWKQSQLPDGKPFTPDRLWVIFAEKNQQLTDCLSQLLEKNLQYCVFVKPGKTFQKLSDHLFEVNPNNSQEFYTLLSEIPQISQLAGVIYLWGFKELPSDPPYPVIEAYMKVNCGGLVNLANALALSHVSESSKLWVVTQSIVSDGNNLSLVQTSLNALSKVIREEYPKSLCSHLALDPDQNPNENCEILSQELRCASIEPQIAWKNGKRFIARMVSTKVKEIRSVGFTDQATYLIAGGLRPLGIRLAQWYIEHGAKTIVLIDENPLTPKIESELNELKAIGGNLRSYVVNFNDFSILELLFKTIETELPPLKGIIHLAGVVDNDLLLHMDWERFKPTHRLKIAGAWNLHLLTQHLNLDHFILFSTALGDLAPLGKASNVTGNTFLDALSHYRKKKGLHSLTIDWAPWETRYIVMQHLIDNSLSTRMKLIQVEDGLKVLEHLFYIDKPQIMAVQVEWSMLLRRLIRENPLYEEMAASFELQTDAVPKKHIAANEQIAIIGMGCRFPGGVDSPEKFWRIFEEGIDTITEVPPDRWDVEAYYDANKEAPGKMYTRYGGFIDHVDLFDPQFFGISPREAEDMDPQQRISLEVTWEALENAGIPPSSLKGSNTGVFMGICFNDYGQLIAQSGEIDAVDDYYSTGNHFSVSAGRISYILGLQGPAMAIDTACSSSLVSIDNAVKHLHEGECEMAIAGGVNLILAPESTINFCKSGMLADDGKCKTFDAAANGYVRSEGCGIVILKRLSDAQRDKNQILAIIRSTAINQDGASTGLTVPNEKAQENVIRAALKKAALEPKDIDFVEAHGTGTSLGDPIEVHAIAATYGQNRDKPLILGSAKTNIGHTEAAAGVAGLIKCTLALQGKKIPRQLHFHQLNPYISLENIVIANEETSLTDKKQHYAAVSSFGFSGTNAHAIIQEAPLPLPTDPEKPPYIFLFSGKTKEALIDQENRIKAFLKTHPEVNLSDVAYTLQVGRDHFQYRSVLIGNTRDELLEATPTRKIDQQKELEKWLAGENVEWKKIYSNQSRQIIHLPTYPFQRERYWVKTAKKSLETSRYALASDHPLLTQLNYLPNGLIQLSGSVDLSRESIYLDHQVYEKVIFPGMGFIELIVAGIKLTDLVNANSLIIKNVWIEKPLLLNVSHPSLVSVLISPESNDSFEIQVDSERLAKDHKIPTWVHHVSARLIPKNQTVKKVDLQALLKKCSKTVPLTDAYDSKGNLDYGVSFQGLKEIRIGENEIVGKIESVESNPHYHLHPVIMDSALQLLMVYLKTKNYPLVQNGLFLPIAFEEIRIHQTHFHEAWAHLTFREVSEAQIATADIVIFDQDGTVLVELVGYQAKYVEAVDFNHLLDSLYGSEDLLYSLQWQDDTTIPDDKEQKYVGIFGKKSLLKEKIKASLQAQFEAVSIKDLSELENSKITDFIFLGFDGELESTKILLDIIQTLIERDNPPHLWIITQGAQGIHNDVDPFQLPLIGLGRTVMNEHPELHCRLVDIEFVGIEDDMVHALINANKENQIAYRDHRRLVARLHSQQQQSLPTHYHLIIPKKGLIENLVIKSKNVNLPAKNEVQIKVYATGLNFRDVLNAMDLYPGDPGPLGLECSGIITAIGEDVKDFAIHDQVMALAWDSFSDTVNVDAQLVAKKPTHLSFDEAASIPLVFLTVYNSLIKLGQLKKGEKVLIHAAAGGIGMAAIQIAQHAGADIYATASPGKWEFLKSKGIQHIYHSRTLDFAESLLKDTQGMGVDLVINALSGEFIEKTLSCVKKKGRFIEIGKRDIWSKEKMKNERPDLTYHIVAIDELMKEAPEKIGEMWKDLSPLFETKALSPLPVTNFSITEAIAAFRYMQAAKHIGKVVLTAVHEGQKLFLEDATYLITGGLGSLGLELAKWLAEQGAKHLVLTIRKEPSTEQKIELDRLEAQGVKINLKKTDVAIKEEIEELIAFIKTNLPPLKGIFHTAGVIDDGVLQQQTWTRFENVFAPKINGSWNLHQATSDLPLDYFVLYSSIVSVLGLTSQSNYAAANAFMDGLSAHRHFLGLPALSINWGPWGEVGMAVRQHMKIGGIKNISLKQGLHALRNLLKSDLSQVIVASINWEEYLKGKFSPLLSELQKTRKRETVQESFILLKNRLQAKPETEREKDLLAYLSEQIRQVLNFKPNQFIDPDRGFFDMGMDSLMAVELKNKLQGDIGRVLMPTLIFNYSTLNSLKKYIQHEIFADLWKEEIASPRGIDEELEIRKQAQELSLDDILKEINKEVDYE